MYEIPLVPTEVFSQNLKNEPRETHGNDSNILHHKQALDIQPAALLSYF